MTATWLARVPPAGRYAVNMRDGRGLLFVVVGHAGAVSRLLSDEPVPLFDPDRSAVLDAVMRDPDAGPRYGREIGQCWRCGRLLTREDSRAAGVGPECRELAANG